MTLTYSAAQELYGKARDKTAGKPLRNHTRLMARGSGTYAVRLHSTDVVTINPDGTYALNTGGWLTVTTKDRINDYSPARVYSAGSQTAGGSAVWCVWHESDPVTAPKIRKCRTCKGTGELHHPGWSTSYGYRDDGTYGELATPFVHPASVSTCYRCNGSKTCDYGSKPNPVRFYDGITVDSDGKPLDQTAPRLYDHLPSDDAHAVVLAAIKAYVDGLTDSKIAELWQAASAGETLGDCLFCQFEANGTAMDSDHLASHVGLGDDDEAPYYMASLVIAAIVARGYRYPGVIFQMGATGRHEDASRIREHVSRYLRKRLVTDRPVR